MSVHSEKVVSSMEDIHRTLKEARRNYSVSGRPIPRSVPSKDVEKLVSEIDRLSTVLKSVAYSYEKLANETIEDPFSNAYEDVMLQLESVRRAIEKAEQCVKSHRTAR